MKYITKEYTGLVPKDEKDLSRIISYLEEMKWSIFRLTEDLKNESNMKKAALFVCKCLNEISTNFQQTAAQKQVREDETLDEIKKRLKPEFKKELHEIFKNVYRSHFTGVKDPKSFFDQGIFIRRSRDIGFTTGGIPFRFDRILFNLYNRAHGDANYVVIVDANQEDVVCLDKDEEFGQEAIGGIIPPKTIKCFIDLKEQKVYYNDQYEERNVNGVNKRLDMSWEVPQIVQHKHDYAYRDDWDWLEKVFDDVCNLSGIINCVERNEPIDSQWFEGIQKRATKNLQEIEKSREIKL